MERIEKIKEMLTENPSDSFLQHALALEYIKREDDAGARVLFETILAREPGYIGSYYHLGKLLERLGKQMPPSGYMKKGWRKPKKRESSMRSGELRGAYEELTF